MIQGKRACQICKKSSYNYKRHFINNGTLHVFTHVGKSCVFFQKYVRSKRIQEILDEVFKGVNYGSIS